MAFERYILDVVRGRQEDAAADLPLIIEAIDARDKWVPTLEELTAALRKLMEDGSIAELPGHRYVDAVFGSGSSEFSPISPAEMKASVEVYDRDFWARVEKLRGEGMAPDQPMWPKLSATFVVSGGQRATDAELKQLGDLSKRMLDALGRAGMAATGGGLSVGPGTVDFPILGHKDADAEQMLETVHLIFATGAPPGSTLVIHEWDPWAALAKIPWPDDPQSKDSE